ncbi:MAG TPA: PAS domain S-box protein, partial [Chthoniobacteraceae bacterium]|nr:PAS domain S-box protein [Chthoniobacteraceae bacterium]
TSAPVTDFIFEEDRPLARENIRDRILGVVESIRYRLRMLRKDGSVIHVEVHGGRMEYNGRPAILGTLLDISEHERAEEALRASEERLRLITNLVPHGIFAKDAAGRYIFVNRALADGCGLPIEEVIGKDDFDLVSDKAQARAYRADDLAVIESGAAKFIPEEANTDWSGRTRILQTTKIPFTAPETGDRAVLGVWVDITDRKRVEESLRIKQEHAESLLRLSRKLERAATFAEILKASREEVQQTLGFGVVWFYLLSDDRKFFRLIRADEGTQPRASVTDGELLVIEGDRMLEELAASDEIVVVEDARTDPRTNKAVVEKLGSRTIVNVPVALAEGRRGVIGTGSFGDEAVRELSAAEREFLSALASHVAAVLDRVTALYARRQAEQEIQLLNTALERRVELRTAELEAANKELEAFSYSVSHDLRAPLRAVNGFSQAVLEDYAAQLPAEGQRYLQTIREAAIRMGQLIDDLLTFSRLSRVPLTRQPVAMSKLVSDVLDEMKAEREGRSIELCLAELPDCEGDAALLKQVWVNLIANAFKYTRKRERAKIEIGAAPGSDGPEYFVRDNGTGFDMRYAGKLFGVFQRLHRAEEFEGTGIGLA